MFRFLRKKRLAARGLSCGKSRLESRETMFGALEEGRLLRFGIVLAASGILALFCLAGDAHDLLKHLLYALLILGLAVVQPVVSGDSALKKNSSLALFLCVILLQVGIGEFLQGQVLQGRLEEHLVSLLIPYALAPLILSVLMGPQIGLSACLIGALWCSVLHVTRDPLPLLLAITGGLAAVLFTLRVRRRSRLLRAGFYSGITVWILALLSGLIGPILWDNLPLTDWWSLGIESSLAIGTGILTAVLVSGSLPMIEKLFGITTEISWLEMADLNHPLLRRLSLEAPGTYHHSLAMANLAEACAEKVGANATLCRVSAYFHDIGKLVKPEYFTENMPSGENLHDELTPTMSALVILSHVKEGVDLALKNKLNDEITDIIRQHHGTSIVSYFYKRARQQQEDARLGGKIMNMREDDIPEVREETFRYPGPRPRTKESAIVNLADSIESASRSLERPTPQRIEDLVNDIVETRIAEHQLDESPLTLAEIYRAAEAFRFTLVNMLHARIAYPKREEPATADRREEKSVA